MEVQDNGDVCLYDEGMNGCFWSTNTRTGGGWPDRIYTGLRPGECIRSPSGEYKLNFENDQRLVLYRIGGLKIGKLWESREPKGWHEDSRSGGRVVVWTTGNMTIQNDHDDSVWSTRSQYSAEKPYVRVQDDGNVCMYDDRKSGLFWETKTTQKPSEPPKPVAKAVVNDRLPSALEYCLAVGESLKSANGRYTLHFSKNGNLALYKKVNRHRNEQLWETKTYISEEDQQGGIVEWTEEDEQLRADEIEEMGPTHCRVALERAGGALVIYASGKDVAWTTGSNNAHGESYLKVQDDGNVCIYDTEEMIWETKTKQQ